MRVCVSNSEYGTPTASGHTSAVGTDGTAIHTHTSGCDWDVLTAADGTLDIDVEASSTPATFYVMAELDGPVTATTVSIAAP